MTGAEAEFTYQHMIPKILHYCFGFDRYFGGKPWSLVHFVCVKSALEHIKPTRAFVYYEYEPEGPWWELTREIVTPVKISAPREVFGNALNHPAHRADVVRLATLIRDGGIYLDTDVIVHESFDELLNNSVVLGAQSRDTAAGLGNAVILAEAGAAFLMRWYEEYSWFRSKGGDKYWSEHSVRVPSKLFSSYPRELTVLPHAAFYWPSHTPDDLYQIYGSPARDGKRGELANHLWESSTGIWRSYLSNLTPGRVRNIDSNFHRWARPYLAGLENDFGTPSLRARYSQFLELQKWRVRSRLTKLRSR